MQVLVFPSLPATRYPLPATRYPLLAISYSYSINCTKRHDSRRDDNEDKIGIYVQ